MIEIHNEKINNIPLLHVVKHGQFEKPLPFVIFVHGFTSAKEHNLHFAYLLAEHGFRVVLPDTMLHGERNEKITKEELAFHFWRIVKNTIADLEVIKRHFSNNRLITEKIGLVGTSMGGIVTFGALTQYDWIDAAVCLMGSPNYVEFARYQIDQLKKAGISLPLSDQELEDEFNSLKMFDLSIKPHLLNGRPLLFWHGEKDPVVPFQPTYHFYQSIKELYNTQPEDLAFIVDHQAGHKVSREALLKTVDWFTKHLLK